MLFSRTLIEDALRPTSAASVAHYTKIGNLRHFVPEINTGRSSAWATPVQFLNDRRELSLGLEVFQRVADKKLMLGQLVRAAIGTLQTTFGDPQTDAYQMSFSGNPDELGQ